MANLVALVSFWYASPGMQSVAHRLLLLTLTCVTGCGTSMLDAKTRGWVVVETANLRVRTDVGADKAVDLAGSYQRMRDAIAEYELPCAFDRLTAPLEVTVFVRAGKPSFFRSSRSPLLGLQPQLVLTSTDERDSVRLFTHEMAHQLVAVCFPGAPVWFNEGMAGFYETTRLEDDQLTLGYPPYVFMRSEDWRVAPVYERELDGQKVWVLANVLAPTVRELRAMSRSEFYSTKYEEEIAHYAGSWALVHLLRYGEPSFYAPFNRYQRALNAGEDEASAWEASFADLDVAARYRRYLTEDYFARARTVQTPRPTNLQARALSQGETALLLAELEPWDDKRGIQRAESYIALAEEQESTRSDARLLRAALLLRLGDRTRSLAVLETALAEDRMNPDVLTALLAMHLGSDEPTEATRQRLIGWLQSLLKTAASSHQFAVAAAWEIRAQQDPRAALAVAQRAIELDGTNLLAYWVAGDAYASLGDLREALDAYKAALALSRRLGDEDRRLLEEQIAAVVVQLAD